MHLFAEPQSDTNQMGVWHKRSHPGHHPPEFGQGLFHGLHGRTCG